MSWPGQQDAAPQTMMAIVPVREGELATGGAECIAELASAELTSAELASAELTSAELTSAELTSAALLIGQGASDAVQQAQLAGANTIAVAQVGAHDASYQPAAWAAALAPLLNEVRIVVLPGSPDGRDLAPRLAYQLGRPLISSAVRITASQITVAKADGRVEQDVTVDQPVVVVLQPGVRSVALAELTDQALPQQLTLDAGDQADATLHQLVPADPATIDLSEAKRIVAGGAGLGEPAKLEELGTFGIGLGASLGATRVLTDAGWIDHARQIGTTGVEVDPTLYIAMGVSGAVQHIMGIGDPDHVISVNTDASCPMMARADLAIVTDARELLTELNKKLGQNEA